MMKSLLFSAVATLLSAQSALSATITLPGNTPFDESLGTVTRKTIIVPERVVNASQRADYVISATVTPIPTQVNNDFLLNGGTFGVIDYDPISYPLFTNATAWVPTTNISQLNYGVLIDEGKVESLSVDYAPLPVFRGNGIIELPSVNQVYSNNVSFTLPSKRVDVPIGLALPSQVVVNNGQTGGIDKAVSLTFAGTGFVSAEFFNATNNSTIRFGDGFFDAGAELFTQPGVELPSLSIPYQTEYEFTPTVVNNDPAQTPEPSSLAALIGFGAISLLGSLKKNESNS